MPSTYEFCMLIIIFKCFDKIPRMAGKEVTIVWRWLRLIPKCKIIKTFDFMTAMHAPSNGRVYTRGEAAKYVL